MKHTQTNTNAALLALRIMMAAIFVFHGSQKLFGWFGGYGLAATGQYMESIGIPFGTANAFMAGSIEFFGGLLLLAGVLIRYVSVPMVFTMLVAAFVAHGGGFDIQQGGMEYPLTLAVVLASLGLQGGGDWTVARLFVSPVNAPDTAIPNT